jgi:hypothetical protein
MTEKERLSLRAQMLSWNHGYKNMSATLEEFKDHETPLHLASAVIGGCCACLLESGYDYLTVNALSMNALLNAQGMAEWLWRELHKPKEKKNRKKQR